MAVRPDKKPRWATVPTVNPTSGKNNVIEPSEGKKDLGWDYLEKITRNALNWVHNKAYEWIDYFDKNTQFLVRENDPTPDLSFILQGGKYFTQGTTLVTITEVTLGPVVAPSSDPRIDRVVLNKLTGVISILTGSEDASPTPPSLSTNEVPIAQIALVVSQTEILNIDITDERPLWDTVLVASLTEAGVSELSTDAEAIAKSDTTRALTPSNLAALGTTNSFAGLIELSTDSEAQAKSDTTRALTPSNLAALAGSITFAGLVEFSTNAEALAKAADDRALRPIDLIQLVASTTFQGLVELATDAEAIAKSDTTRALTPDNLAALHPPTTSFAGLIFTASDAAAQAKSNTANALVPSNLLALASSSTFQGLVELATDSEAQTGTDTSRALTAANLASILTFGPAASGFFKFTNVYLADDGVNLTTFDVDAVIGSPFESIGPTGSSATNIWTAMDNIPSIAKAVLLRFWINVAGSTVANNYNVQINARKTGSSLTAGFLTVVGTVGFTNRSGASQQDFTSNDIWVPIDSNLRFDLQHTNNGTGVSDASEMMLIGFGV